MDLNVQALPLSQSSFIVCANITGTKAGKGRLSFWKTFKGCNIGIKQAFADLGNLVILEDHIVGQDERYVCPLGQPDMNITFVSD